MKALLLFYRLALLLPLLGVSLLAQASHFRFGSITYQTNGATNRDVTFRVTEAWRNDAFGSPPVLGQQVTVDGELEFGDGVYSAVTLTVTTVGPGYFYGEAIITHTYATAGTYVANIYDCCRISTLQNNADGYFYISTPVVAGNANDSPVSTLLPIVNLAPGQATASYTLPATDPNGNTLTYSAATGADLGNIGFTNAPGLTVNSTTGQVTFSTVGKTVGQLYNAVVKVSDGSTSIILDHLIQISNVASNAAPVFTAPTPANGTVYTISPGQLLTFTVRATDADAGDNVTLQSLGAPAGAASVPALPTTGNPVQTVFSFTPTATQLGSYIVSFVAQDNSGTQTTSSVTVQVQTPTAVCNPATNLVATPLSSTSASLTFTAGSGATAYSVTYTPGGGTAQTLPAATSPVSLTNLTPGTPYTVTVTSQCAAGQTATTAAVSFTTPAAPATASLSVLYQTGDLDQPADNIVQPYLELVNTGTAAVPYQQLTVRYWLTVEDYFSPLLTPIDWAKLGTSFVSARYVGLPTPYQGAYGYIEYSFAAGAGSLAAGSNSGPIYTKLYQQRWTALNDLDDYSYQLSSSFAPNNHITVYQNGTLVSGIEPPAIAAVTSLKVYAGNQDTSPTTSVISVYLQVGNVGTLPVNFADLKVRYWFTPDGTQPLVYTVDFAKLGSSNFDLQTGQKGTETYAEMSFAGALGTFYPSSNTNNIQFRIRKNNWNALTQTNDYSFQASSAIAEQPRITAYLGGQLVYGTEPAGAATATALRGASAANTAAAPRPAGAADGLALAEQLTGSPNPFTDQLQLQFALAGAEAYTLAIYDGQGRLVQQLPGSRVEAGQLQQVAVPTQGYAAGLYLVRLTTATGKQQLKFVKH